jgi:RNA:NAD 2'-phosphotransferase (TPT1/KptA family)
MAASPVMNILWTNYLRHRALTRRVDLAVIEHILRFSSERCFDTVAHRMVAVRGHGNHLVMVPYEQEHDTVTPITVHAATRQQINVRLRTGRFTRL